MDKWKDAVGEYSHVVDLKLLEVRRPSIASILSLTDWFTFLQGEHLLKPPPSSQPNKQPLIQPFSVTTLPTDPAARFTDLFLTRSRWRPEEMQPFLKGLTPEGDRKAMDKLVVKYVRVVKESGREGSMVWWHARR
jgi:sister chromatid cohesion protein DCC1